MPGGTRTSAHAPLLRVPQPAMPASSSCAPCLCSPASALLCCRRRPNPPTTGSLRGVLRYLRLETFLVLLGAFFINLCVICVFAEGFYGTGAPAVPLDSRLF